MRNSTPKAQSDSKKLPQSRRNSLLVMAVMSVASCLILAPLISGSADAAQDDGGFMIHSEDSEGFTGTSGRATTGTDTETSPNYLSCWSTSSDTLGSLRDQAAAGKNVGAGSKEEAAAYFEGKLEDAIVLLNPSDRDCEPLTVPGLRLVNSATGQTFVPNMAGSNAWFRGIPTGTYTVQVDRPVLSAPESIEVVVGESGWFSVTEGSFHPAADLVLG